MKKHGFQNPVPTSTQDSYAAYCWFIYPAYDATGERCGTVEELFPPTMQEDRYGGKTPTEIRSLAMDRLNALYRKHGHEDVKVEML